MTIHLAVDVGRVACGADYPDMSSTTLLKNATCSDCLATVFDSTAAEAAATKKDRENRLRRLHVSEMEIFLGIATRKRDGQTLMHAALRIPDDVEVLSVHHDWATKGFSFTLRHPSFGIVQDGEEIPRLEGTELNQLEYTAFRIATPEADVARDKEFAEVRHEAETYWRLINEIWKLVSSAIPASCYDQMQDIMCQATKTRLENGHDLSPIPRPEKSDIKKAIAKAIVNLGVVSAASRGDKLRWSPSDLATDIVDALYPGAGPNVIEKVDEADKPFEIS